MFWLVLGYLFLFIVRPFEYWPIVGEYHIQRLYMLLLMTAVLIWKDKGYISDSINNSVILFFAVLALSSVSALSWNDAQTKLFDYFKLVVFYFILIVCIRDERQLKTFVLAYLAIMFVYVGKSAWEFFVHDRHVYRMGVRRMIGMDTTYGDPNAFAASIVYSLPFLCALLRYKSRNVWKNRMLWGYALLAPVCIIFTGSRSGMVTALLFVALLWIQTRRKVVGAVVLCSAIIFVWATMPEKYQLRFMTTFQSGINESADASAGGRIYTLRRGVHMFQKYPLLGVGPGNFGKGLEMFDDTSGLSAHNLYGMLLGETGLFGFLTFFLLIYNIISTHRNVIRKSRNTGDSFYPLVSVASIQSIILLLFNGNFGGNLYRYNWLWIGAIGVLSSHFLQMRQTSKAASVQSPKWNKGHV